MLAVEQFGGKRGDKDYMYLDEMLTRNLLKLDTIDTNGKESIRMARKEAIKCIQTSIAVLEAKSALNLNEKRDNVDQTNIEQSATGNESTATIAPAAEKMDTEETNFETSATNSGGSDQMSVTDSSVDIPKVENISIDDKPINDKEISPTKTEQNKETEKEMKSEENNATPECADAQK